MGTDSRSGAAPKTLVRKRYWITPIVAWLVLASSMLPGMGWRADAEPADDPPPAPPMFTPSPDSAAFPPLPVFTPTASNWEPKFPFPYDETRKNVTDNDIAAEREMCQWFNAQYRDLVRQMDAFGFNLLAANNDWTAGQIQAQADALASNIDQTVAFLTPRAEALTQSVDFTGGVYFPIYQGESFYRFWQYLSNTGTGIKARNTAWVYGPSQQRVEHWGSRIQRSHVCD